MMRRSGNVPAKTTDTDPVELDTRPIVRGILVIIALAAVLLVCIRYALL